MQGATPPAAPRGRTLLLAALALAVLGAGVALSIRPLLPPDETRYVTVAQEMRDRGDFLVPHLRGAPYPDKPPLLFWLVNLAWTLLGESVGVARLVPPLAGFGVLALTALLGRRLWPDRERVGGLAALILVGGLAWALYSTLLMFDTLIACCALATLLGAWEAARGRTAAWLLVAAGLGIGLLAKGPVLFVHVLPVLLLAPWWWPEGRPFRARWYALVAACVLVGAAMVLAWALPAAQAGGPAYADNVLWNQTANRMLKAFAHRRPPWWYLPLLPLMFLPWALWVPTWKGLAALRVSDRGVRFCIAWAAGMFLGLSLISGKQVHYMLPSLAGIALLLARGLDEAPAPRRWDVLPVVLGVGALGVALAAACVHLRGGELPPGASPAFMHLRLPELLILGPALLVVLLPRPAHAAWRVAQLALAGLLAAVLLQASVVGWGHYRAGGWPPWEPSGSVAVPVDPR